MKKLSLQQTAKALSDDMMSMVDETKLTKSGLKELFEEHFKGRLDFKGSPQTHHVYEDPKTEAIFLAFKLTVKESRIAINRSLKKGPTKAPYIVGTMVGDGTIQFGYRPVRHGNPEKAIAEAQRLNKNYGKNTVVLGTIHKVHGDMVKPEESKQGVNGGRSNNTRISNLTMERLRKFLEESPSTVRKSDTPIAIVMRTTGMFIQFMQAEDKPIRNFNEGVVFISNWLDVEEAALTHDWQAIRDKVDSVSPELRHKTMMAVLPQRSPPTTLKSTTDGIYPLLPESVKADKPAE